MIKSSDLEPIVRAVPSFQDEWNDLLNRGVDPALIGVEFFTLLARYLAARATVRDFTEFGPLFDALEISLSDPSTELFDALTMGFLEDLIHACEDRNIDLKEVKACIKGKRTLEEWEAACAYTGQKSG